MSERLEELVRQAAPTPGREVDAGVVWRRVGAVGGRAVSGWRLRRRLWRSQEPAGW